MANNDPKKKGDGQKPHEFTGDAKTDSKGVMENTEKRVNEGFEFREYDPAIANGHLLDIEMARQAGDEEEVKRLEKEHNDYVYESYYNRYNQINKMFTDGEIALNEAIKNAKTPEEANEYKRQKLALANNQKQWRAEADKFTENVGKSSYSLDWSTDDTATTPGSTGGALLSLLPSVKETKGTVDYDGMEKALRSTVPDEQLPPQQNPDDYEQDSSGKFVRKDYGFAKVPMASYKGKPKAVNPFNINDVTKATTLVDTKRDADNQKYNTDVELEDFDYENTVTDGIGLVDYLMPAAQIITGAFGASEPLPDPEMSPEMRTIIDEDMARRNQGLTPAEIDYRNKQAERGYAYDVSNIRRMSGGSAGAALAALGGASGRVQDQYAQTAAIDEQMRRQNQAIARQSAMQAEDFERYAFGIDYNEAMMDAQAAGQLGAMGLQELTDLRQYKRNYGEGSAYLEYMKELHKDKALSNHEREQSMKNTENLLQHRSGTALK